VQDKTETFFFCRLYHKERIPEETAMDSEPDPTLRRQRETFLTILLCTLVVAGGTVFMVGLMGMFVIHAITVMAVVVCFGMFHYLVWGRSLSRQVEAEREEEEGFRPLDDAGPPDDAIQSRKY
jgi:hypothetical protein